MAGLKGVIFSLRDVLAQKGPIDNELFDETLKLLRFLKSKGITPVFATNHVWEVTVNGKKVSFEDYLSQKIGPVKFYVAQRGDMGWKPTAAAVGSILADQGWDKREVIYVGNSHDDMVTARNGKVLFLNVLWHGEANPYGFQFDSPKDLARFIDCICLGLDEWFWKIEDGNLRVYSLAPYTTMSPALSAAHAYSAGAKATAKSGADDAGFWGRMLAARTYFSGLVDEIDFITAYPGHSPASKPSVVADALGILAESLHKKFLPDLIIRHTKAQQSHTARAAGNTVGLVNQLSTIHLNEHPRKGLDADPYKTNPMRKGKTVLVVDDLCTEGNSFEAARSFIEATGARVIALSWLKTINRDYTEISRRVPIGNPYAPLNVAQEPPTKGHWYSNAIVDRKVMTDLAEVYARYYKWDWP
jgi:hypothetical protein